MLKKLLFIGGGGHCHSVLDAAIAMEEYEQIGIIDNKADICLCGITRVGQDEDLQRLKEEGWTHAFVSLGSIGDTSLRRKIFLNVKKLGFTVPNIIDPSATMAKEVYLGEGIFVGKNTVINAGSHIKDCSIINTGAIIEHDCYVGSFAHISPGAVICGQVSVGADSHVGARTVVRQQITIGSKSIIGAGSVVVKDIPDNSTAYGNPCKVIK